jgi:hypothetical protein
LVHVRDQDLCPSQLLTVFLENRLLDPRDKRTTK